ncbi:hypothetical protein EJB05_13176, partial [Eragrostis curvula]
MHDSSKMLFYGRIFGSEDKCPAEFSEVAEKILRKCGGVPLAIITISSLLANKSKDIADWYELCDSIGSGLGNDPGMNDMRKILSLSYYDLPSHLKTCLLYISIFPEDYEIRMDRLVLRWIGEGFVQCSKRGDGLFEIGESYFNELVNRSMIQELNIDAEGISCRVHDMVLDLICSLAREENFVTISHDIEQKPWLQSKVRRLSLHNTIGATTNMSQARSFTVFSPAISSMPCLSCFHVLRVLDLEGCDLKGGGHRIMRYVWNLPQLRYLGLRCTKGIHDLPVGNIRIGKLQFLQILDMAGTLVSELPVSTVQLPRLMCLRIDRWTRLPSGIGKLTLLEELSGVSTLRSSPDIVKELGGLTDLRVLRIKLWKPSRSLEEALVESLCNLRKIHTLDIYIDLIDYHVAHRLDVVRDSWVPPRCLRELRIQAFSCVFSPLRLLPAWVNALTVPHLAVLVVQVMELRQEDVDALGRLPALSFLRLEADTMRELLTVGSGSFPRLTECNFESNIGLVFRRGAMALLRRLQFCFHVRETIDIGNGRFEFGLENLGCVEEITISVGFEDATEEEAESAEEALRRAEDTHPNRAIFDVCIGGEELMRFEDDDDNQ